MTGSRLRALAAGMVSLLLVAAEPAGAIHGLAGSVPTVGADEVRRLLEGRERPALVDLRPAAEYQKGHLPGARSIPVGELRRRFHEIPRGRVILYCACSGEDAQAAAQLLRDRGIADVSVLGEGFPGWVARGYPLER
ncbi:MAG TPA: rhodanese-like domain-containing protein [Methylomirabilota bacterium]|nr:rhodanese-like domain-containing protein [Methylomirabilota bacterium]